MEKTVVVRKLSEYKEDRTRLQSFEQHPENTVILRDVLKRSV